MSISKAVGAPANCTSAFHAKSSVAPEGVPTLPYPAQCTPSVTFHTRPSSPVPGVPSTSALRSLEVQMPKKEEAGGVLATFPLGLIHDRHPHVVSVPRHGGLDTKQCRRGVFRQRVGSEDDSIVRGWGGDVVQRAFCGIPHAS